MTFTTAFSFAATILGLAGLAGAAFAVLRANIAQTTTNLWKGEAEAANRKSTRLETEEFPALKAEIAAARAETQAAKEAERGCQERLADFQELLRAVLGEDAVDHALARIARKRQ